MSTVANIQTTDLLQITALVSRERHLQLKVNHSRLGNIHISVLCLVNLVSSSSEKVLNQASRFLLAKVSDSVSAIGIVHNSSMLLMCVVRLTTIFLSVCLFRITQKISDMLISVLNP